MNKSLVVLALNLLFPAIAPGQSVKLQHSDKGEDFRINQSLPYVYLQVDHMGPRTPWGANEAKTGVWLRLHNNSRVPIKIRTFGAPPDSEVGEIGVQDRVVPNVIPILATAEKTPLPDLSPSPLAKDLNNSSGLERPYGYLSDTSTLTTIKPGRDVYFSLPSNHISANWHVEIPFELVLPSTSHLREPYNFVAIYEDDLPRERAAIPTK